MIHRDFLLHGTVRLKPEAKERLGIVWCVFPGLSPVELVGGNGVLPLGAGNLNAATPSGPGASSASTSSEGLYAPGNAELWAVGDQMSMGWLGVKSSLTDYSANISVPYRTSGWSVPYTALGFVRNAASTEMVLNYSPNSSGQNFVTSDSSMTATGASEVLEGVSRAGTSVLFYKNGVQFGAGKTITGGVPDWSGRTDPCVLNRSRYSAGEGISGNCFCAFITNRPWTSDEWAEFWADPTAILEPEDTFAAWIATEAAPPGDFQAAWARGSNVVLNTRIAA